MTYPFSKLLVILKILQNTLQKRPVSYTCVFIIIFIYLFIFFFQIRDDAQVGTNYIKFVYTRLQILTFSLNFMFQILM